MFLTLVAFPIKTQW